MGTISYNKRQENVFQLKNNFVYQDFGKAFYNSLTEVIDWFKKYIELGTKGAEFITNEGPMQHCVSTNLIIRELL